MSIPSGSSSTSKARRGPSAPSHERWLVSYADFMTLLCAFFVVLFASSRSNYQSLHKIAGSIRQGFSEMSVYSPDGSAASTPPEGAQPAASSLDLPRLEKQLQEVLGDSIARHEIVIQQRPDGLVISLRELGFFSSGQAGLVSGAAEKINRVSQVLSEHHLQIRVEGHSDDQPIHNAAFHSNWQLSAARAMTVLELMVNEGGFDPANISLGAFGPYRALASNATPEGRRINRRVDLVVVRQPVPSAPPK